MAVVLKFSGDDNFVAVNFGHACQPTPGQCVTVEGKYFAIADSDGDTLTLIGKPGGVLDVHPGDSLSLIGPIGPGFADIDCDSAVIVSGGTAVGACFSLLERRRRLGLPTWFVSYTRHTHPLASSVEHHGGLNWNTSQRGRPLTPLTPFNVCLFPAGTRIFVAGPDELVKSVKKHSEHFGISSDNINLNY